MSSFSSQEHLFLPPRLCLFSAFSLAHSQSNTSHSLIKSKRVVALFLAAVNSHTHRSRPPPRIRWLWSSLQRQHSSSLITQKIQLNVLSGRGCLWECVKICQPLKRPQSSRESIREPTDLQFTDEQSNRLTCNPVRSQHPSNPIPLPFMLGEENRFLETQTYIIFSVCLSKCLFFITWVQRFRRTNFKRWWLAHHQWPKRQWKPPKNCGIAGFCTSCWAVTWQTNKTLTAVFHLIKWAKWHAMLLKCIFPKFFHTFKVNKDRIVLDELFYRK